MRHTVAVFAVLAVIGVGVAVTRQVPVHEIAAAVGLGYLFGARRRG